MVGEVQCINDLFRTVITQQYGHLPKSIEINHCRRHLSFYLQLDLTNLEFVNQPAGLVRGGVLPRRGLTLKGLSLVAQVGDIGEGVLIFAM